MRILNKKKSAIGAVALLLALGLGGGCVLELYGQSSEDQALYYPVSMAASADGQFVYVLNSNYDQRYNTGWVSVMDMDAVVAQAGDLTPTHAPLVTRADGGQVSVLNLGGMLAFDASGEHLLVSHRGQNHLSQTRLSWLDVAEDGSISCGDADFTGDMTARESKTDCDEDHIIRVEEDGGDDTNADYTTESTFPASSFENAYSVGSFVMQQDDGTTRSVMAVGFLDSRYLRLYDVIDGALVFINTLKLEITGAGHMAYRSSGDDQFLLVGGRSISENGIAAVDLKRSLAEEETVSYSSSLDSLVAASVLGMDVSPDGSRIYVGSGDPRPTADGVPDVLAVIDGGSRLTNEDAQGGQAVVRPALDVLSMEPLLGRPSAVRYIPRGPSATGEAREDLLAVSAFDGDVLYIFAPTGQGVRPVARFELDTKSPDTNGVGEGPFALEVVERNGRTFLLAANFFEHSISVFDVSAASPTDFTQVAKVQNETIE